MNMEFTVQVDGKVYEISELVTNVSYKDALNEGCSKLEFSYIKKDLELKNGSNVKFKYDDDKTFDGHVFKFNTGKGKESSVVAYDQLRYCKAKDTIVADGDTVTTLVNKMCNYFNLNRGAVADTGYVLPVSIHDDKTWLDIIYAAIVDTLVAKKKKYALRDEFGAITLRDIEELQLDLVLGDKSLCYGYEHEKSIDEDFYNHIKIAVDNEKTGKRESYIAKDDASIKTYGLLQHFEVLDKKANATQAKTRADDLLNKYHNETETLTLECLGDVRIRAGNSFYGSIADISLNKKLIVKSVTHKYLPVHTMSLEVFV